jgi:pimeloyl-ACP methyl ester carboxylesterase/ketosteroid isomerase-like protein
MKYVRFRVPSSHLSSGSWCSTLRAAIERLVELAEELASARPRFLTPALVIALTTAYVTTSHAQETASDTVTALTNQFVAAWNDDIYQQVAHFYASDAVLVIASGRVLQGRDVIVRDFLRPNVARMRGMRLGFSKTFGGEGAVTVVGAYSARFSPASDTAHALLSNTWARQPDGRWLIVASTFELPAPRDGVSNGIRSRFFHSDGVRIHYLDFGGEGLPLLFLPSVTRTAHTWIDFAARFRDGYRVLAITHRGSGESEGEPVAAWADETKVRDAITLLDSLGIERAVMVDRWAALPVRLGEQHPDRVAGLVILRPTPEPNSIELRRQDATGVLKMQDRFGASLFGLAPDDTPWRDNYYEPRYLRTGTLIAVPALTFVNEKGSRNVEDEWKTHLSFAQLLRRDPLMPADSLTRAYFQQLAVDTVLQQKVRAFYRDVLAPATLAAERALLRAFGARLRVVRLATTDEISGYEYRHAPELFYPHIRSFLDRLRAGPGERSPGGPAR